jgi:hypothetical protein
MDDEEASDGGQPKWRVVALGILLAVVIVGYAVILIRI